MGAQRGQRSAAGFAGGRRSPATPTLVCACPMLLLARHHDHQAGAYRLVVLFAHTCHRTCSIYHFFFLLNAVTDSCARVVKILS